MAVNYFLENGYDIMHTIEELFALVASVFAIFYFLVFTNYC